MEVSAITASSTQFPQALNGTAPATETGSPQSGTNVSARFSRLLGQYAGMGKEVNGSTVPLANAMFLKVVAASTQQQGLMQQKEPALESDQGTEVDRETTALSGQGREPDDRSPGDGVQAATAQPAFTGFPWAQTVVAVNPNIVENTASPLAEASEMQSSQSDETAISAVDGKAQAGFMGLGELSAQNRQGILSQQVNTQGEKPAKVNPDHPPMLSLRDAPATPISEADSSVMQSGLSGKTAVDGGQPRNTAGNAILDISDVSISVQKSGLPRSATFPSGTALFSLVPQGTGANPDGVAEPDGNGLNRATNAAMQQQADDSLEVGGFSLRPAQEQKTDISASGSQKADNPVQVPEVAAETKIGSEIRVSGKEVESAYRASSGGAANSVRGAVSPVVAGIMSTVQTAMQRPTLDTQEQVSSDQSEKQGSKDAAQSLKSKVDAANPAAKPELNSMDPSAKPGLNSVAPEQAQQQVETAFDGELKTMVKEAGDKLVGKRSEDKSEVIDVSNPVVHTSGEARVLGDGKVPTPANDGKLPFAEQIQHQVREKLESGDFGLNKGSITLKLHPQELGELKINMRMEDQHLKVEITTQNQSVKDALMQNLDTLKDTLTRQNITMDRFNVSADVRQGFQQGSRDGGRMMQDNRGGYTPLNTVLEAEESVIPNLHYGWESDNSMVSLVL